MVTSIVVTSAGISASRTTRVEIGIALSARGSHGLNGSRTVRQNCSTRPTSTWVHRTGPDRHHRVPEPDRGLRYPIPGGVRDVAHHRRRSGASGRRDRLPRCAAHPGTKLVAPPAHSFFGSRRRDRAGRRKLDRLSTGILPVGPGAIADVSWVVPAVPGAGIHRRRVEVLRRAPSPV